MIFIGHPLNSHENYGVYWLMCWWEHQQLPFVELMYEGTVIVATIILFVAHKWGFLCILLSMGTAPPL
jgi:hypothetical protein